MVFLGGCAVVITTSSYQLIKLISRDPEKSINSEYVPYSYAVQCINLCCIAANNG